MSFSLLALVGFVTLVALELFSLKTPSDFNQSVVGYVIYFCILGSTWGAFFLGGQLRQFCKGFAVLAWASILFQVFVREEYSATQASPLAKKAAEFLELPVTTDLDPFSSSDQAGDFSFYKTWNYWSLLNFGLLGGFLALQIRHPLVAGHFPEKSPAPPEPQEIKAVPIAAPASENS